MLSTLDAAVIAGGARSPQPLPRKPRQAKSHSAQKQGKLQGNSFCEKAQTMTTSTSAFALPPPPPAPSSTFTISLPEPADQGESTASAADCKPKPNDRSEKQQQQQQQQQQPMASAAPQRRRVLIDVDDAPRFVAHKVEVAAVVGDRDMIEHEVEELEEPQSLRRLLNNDEHLEPWLALSTDIMSWVGMFDACKVACASFAIQQAVKGLTGRTQMVDVSGHFDATGWSLAQLIATIGRFCPTVTAFVDSDIGADVTFYGASLTNHCPTISQLKFMDCARSLQFLTVCCTATHLSGVLRSPQRQLPSLKFLRMNAARLSIKESTQLQEAWTHVPHLTLSGTLWSNHLVDKGVNIVHDRAQSFTRALGISTVGNLRELGLDFKDWVQFESDWDCISESIKGLPLELTGMQLSFWDPDTYPYKYLNRSENSFDLEDWADEFDEIQREMGEKFGHLQRCGVLSDERRSVRDVVVLALGTAIGHWNWLRQTQDHGRIEFF